LTIRAGVSLGVGRGGRFPIAPLDLPATTSLLTVVAGRIVWDAGVLHPAP